jgi:hypothetical protein
MQSTHKLYRRPLRSLCLRGDIIQLPTLGEKDNPIFMYTHMNYTARKTISVSWSDKVNGS